MAKSKKNIQTYTHNDKERLNNPPVGLVSKESDKDGTKKSYRYDYHFDPELQWDQSNAAVRDKLDDSLKAQQTAIDTLETQLKELQEQGDLPKATLEALTMQLDLLKKENKNLQKAQQPFLNWAGKAERTSFDIPTVSLHVHERIDPRRIIKEVEKEKEGGEQLSLFEKTKRPRREEIQFYQHKDNWSNRLIAGDSLLVMNSLLEKEGMAGKVQMVYIDPPYGIKYGSNFQPFVNKRDVKDGKDEDLTAEPEMIKAFRDTWELGIHSYLSYLRDRLLLAKELLHENGSIFVQISDENVHRVRTMMDEIFGESNFVSEIVAIKAGALGSKKLSRRNDFVIWYAKSEANLKYNQIFIEQEYKEKSSQYDNILTEKGNIRKATKEEKELKRLPKGLKAFRYVILTKPGPGSKYEIEVNDKIYSSGSRWWGFPKVSLEKLINKKRAVVVGNSISGVRYFDDFPAVELNNIWTDTGTGSGMGKIYVVQTNEKIIQRCMLMASEPGDLILDITCGSGTSAKVAENWGRRWITCDTSRIAVTLAKQRLLTELYEYYLLNQPNQGISSGFKYKSLPRITLKSIANNEQPKQEIFYDQPLKDNSKVRVTGPFTVESVPAPTVRSLDTPETKELSADDSVSRSGETLRQDEWQDELLRTGIQAKGGAKIEFSRLETQEGTRHIQAIGETKGENPKRVFVIFGPEHAPMEQRQVDAALDEVSTLRPKPDMVLFCAYQFDEEAAKDIDETKFGSTLLLRSVMNMDLQTEDLKKKSRSSQSFWLVGSPDVIIRKDAEDANKHVVEVKGFDYYDPRSGEVKSGTAKNIAMWMLDPDYDGRSLFPTQIFFPMAGAKDGWAKLAKTLKAEIDTDKIAAFRGTVSLPFKAGTRVGVKIIDDRGIESLKILYLHELNQRQ